MGMRAGADGKEEKEHEMEKKKSRRGRQKER